MYKNIDQDLLLNLYVNNLILVDTMLYYNVAYHVKSLKRIYILKVKNKKYQKYYI